jgi:hypothetical protein
VKVDSRLAAGTGPELEAQPLDLLAVTDELCPALVVVFRAAIHM